MLHVMVVCLFGATKCLFFRLFMSLPKCLSASFEIVNPDNIVIRSRKFWHYSPHFSGLKYSKFCGIRKTSLEFVM